MDNYIEDELDEAYDAANYENYQKYNYIKELHKNQIRIDQEIEVLSSELEKIPKMPKNMDYWISSFESKFKMSDLDKLTKINKKYRALMEERKSNGSKIKMFAIDNIITQIEDVVKK